MKCVKWVLNICAILLVLSGCGNSVSDEELNHLVEIERGASLYIYDSVSDHVMDRAIGFVEKKEIDSDNYSYVFANSKYTNNLRYYDLDYKPDYINDKENFVYYVIQQYNGLYTGGYYTLDLEGKICKEEGILSKSDIANIDMNIKYEVYEAVDKINELKKKDYSIANLETGGYLRIKKQSDNCYVLCYFFQFDDGAKFYLNAITGTLVN